MPLLKNTYKSIVYTFMDEHELVYNKFIKHRSGAKRRASTGQPTLRFGCRL